MVGKYKVICLCGSTKFKDAYIEAQKQLSLHGCIVISVGLFGHSGDSITDADKIMLDDIHKRKIDMADAIFVIDKSSELSNELTYIGNSTKTEIEYAKATYKQIAYLSKDSYEAVASNMYLLPRQNSCKFCYWNKEEAFNCAICHNHDKFEWSCNACKYYDISIKHTNCKLTNDDGSMNCSCGDSFVFDVTKVPTAEDELKQSKQDNNIV